MVVDNKTSTTNNLHLPPFTTFQPLNTTVPYSPTVSLVLSFQEATKDGDIAHRKFYAALFLQR